MAVGATLRTLVGRESHGRARSRPPPCVRCTSCRPDDPLIVVLTAASGTLVIRRSTAASSRTADYWVGVTISTRRCRRLGIGVGAAPTPGPARRRSRRRSGGDGAGGGHAGHGTTPGSVPRSAGGLRGPRVAQAEHPLGVGHGGRAQRHVGQRAEPARASSHRTTRSSAVNRQGAATATRSRPWSAAAFPPRTARFTSSVDAG